MTDQAMPADSKARKDTPIVRGALDYFPAALAAVAQLSRAGNQKHNPGEEMHHARGKSNDHADCIVRHLVDRGTVDQEDGIRHSVKVAWRALALLQEELEEEENAPLARGARLPADAVPKYRSGVVLRDNDQHSHTVILLEPNPGEGDWRAVDSGPGWDNRQRSVHESALDAHYTIIAEPR